MGFRELKKTLPSWIDGSRDVKLLTVDPDFPQSWEPILSKVKARKQVELLLGM